MRPLPQLILGLLIPLSLAACASLPAPTGPDPLYDFDSVWFGDGIGGVTPWRPRDRKAITEAALDAEMKARRGSRRDKRVAQATKAARPQAKSSKKAAAASRKKTAAPKKTAATRKTPAPKKTAATRKTPAPKKTASTKKTSAPTKSAAARPRPPVARIPPTRQPEPAARTHPLLGDGSVPGELLAAAQRTLGIKDGFDGQPYLSHLLTVAAIDVVVTAPADRYNAEVWARLSTDNLTFEGVTPEIGDLAFFHRVTDLDGDGTNDPFSLVAVVERVMPSGVIICIGEVRGEVRRFAMDPARPWVVRDDATGDEINTPLVRQSLKDRPGAVTLAGGLLAGYARP